MNNAGNGEVTQQDNQKIEDIRRCRNNLRATPVNHGEILVQTERGKNQNYDMQKQTAAI